MRTALSLLFVIGLTLVAYGQDAAAPPQHAPSDISATPTKMTIASLQTGTVAVRHPGDVVEVRGRVVAKDVVIEVGSSSVTADEAEIRYGAAGGADEVELRGTVLMRTKLKVEYR
jgi:hypothetical protein